MGKVKAIVTIFPERIADIMCCAMEGGIDYWAGPVGHSGKYTRTPMFHDRPDSPLNPWYADPAFWALPDFKVTVVPEEGIEADEDTPRKRTFGPTKLRQAFQIIADKYPRHFANMTCSQDDVQWDAETGDVLFQVAAFGDIIFG